MGDSLRSSVNTSQEVMLQQINAVEGPPREMLQQIVGVQSAINDIKVEFQQGRKDLRSKLGTVRDELNSKNEQFRSEITSIRTQTVMDLMLVNEHLDGGISNINNKIIASEEKHLQDHIQLKNKVTESQKP